MNQKTVYKRFQVSKRHLANRQVSIGKFAPKYGSGTTIDVTISA